MRRVDSYSGTSNFALHPEENSLYEAYDPLFWPDLLLSSVLNICRAHRICGMCRVPQKVKSYKTSHCLAR